MWGFGKKKAVVEKQVETPVGNGDREQWYRAGFDRGFSFALELMPNIDARLKASIEQKAIDNTLKRLQNGHKL